MVSKFTVISAIVIMILLVSACSPASSSPAPPLSPQRSMEQPLSFDADELSKPVAATEIESFFVTLTHAGPTDTEVDVSLETTQGASWKAALCFEDFCYMHNGQDTMHQTLAVTGKEVRQLEIKMFIPKTAISGQAKTLKLAAAAIENPETPISLELDGYIP